MDYEALGSRIRNARKVRGMTQAECAKAIQRSLPFYGHIERGTRKMSMETFFEIAKVLDVSADELLGLGRDQRKKELHARELLEMALKIAETIEDSDPKG